MSNASAAVSKIANGLPDSRRLEADLDGKIINIREYRVARNSAANAQLVANEQPTAAAWQKTALSRVCKLLELKDGWDSYKARAIKHETAMFALQLLHMIMRPDTPAPVIVPSSVGGIQLEWHTSKADLEIHIGAPYDCDIWFEDHATGEGVEMALIDRFDMLSAPLDILGSA